MDEKEHKRFIEWIDSNPFIPAGKTVLEVWKEKERNDLGRFL
jgi:hypothetical protein